MVKVALSWSSKIYMSGKKGLPSVVFQYWVDWLAWPQRVLLTQLFPLRPSPGRARQHQKAQRLLFVGRRTEREIQERIKLGAIPSSNLTSQESLCSPGGERMGCVRREPCILHLMCTDNYPDRQGACDLAITPSSPTALQATSSIRALHMAVCASLVLQF